MAKKFYSNEQNEPVRIQTEVAQDPKSGEWVVTSLQAPRISARDVDPGKASRQLAKEAAKMLGKPVQIVEKIRLPKHLATEVNQYLRDLEKYNELGKSLYERRIPLVQKLRVERLQQQQISDLLKISPQRLGQQLKNERTGTVRLEEDN